MAGKARSSSGGKTARRSPRGGKTRRWSQSVTEGSDAMDLEPGVFKRASAEGIARSVKRSAERSRRRKSEPFRSAMSMLTFYINRAGKNLPKAQRDRLMQAKDKLRGLFHRTAAKG